MVIIQVSDSEPVGVAAGTEEEEGLLHEPNTTDLRR